MSARCSGYRDSWPAAPGAMCDRCIIRPVLGSLCWKRSSLPVRPPTVRWPEEPLCDNCYTTALRRRGQCERCGALCRLVSPPGRHHLRRLANGPPPAATAASKTSPTNEVGARPAACAVAPRCYYAATATRCRRNSPASTPRSSPPPPSPTADSPMWTCSWAPGRRLATCAPADGRHCSALSASGSPQR